MKSMSASALLSNFAVSESTTAKRSIANVMQEILHAIRKHLGMDVAFLSEFAEGKRFFRYVDSASKHNLVKVGASDPLENTYCQRVVDGRLPELMQDAKQNPTAAELAVTAALPVGAHLSVPITLSNGQVYGTFCCFSHTPDPTLTERDLNLMRTFAQLATKQIEQDVITHKKQMEIEQRIGTLLKGNELFIEYQPIYNLEEKCIAGFESLSRFATEPKRSPDAWFTEAIYANLGVELETKSIRAALEGLKYLPKEVYLSINASPATILQGNLETALKDMPLERLVLEVTEHALIEQYDELASALQPLRSSGLKLAVDDAGAGYASFRHILNLSPDIIKLDMSLTRNIASDRAKRALTAALISFSKETGITLIVEGVETLSEFRMLRRLGITKIQGYLIGRPLPIKQAVRLCNKKRSSSRPVTLEEPVPSA